MNILFGKTEVSDFGALLLEKIGGLFDQPFWG
jgi:hypothetical protein